MKLNSQELCNHCKRPIGDGSGGWQSDKTCRGNCLKIKVLPPPPARPKGYGKKLTK